MKLAREEMWMRAHVMALEADDQRFLDLIDQDPKECFDSSYCYHASFEQVCRSVVQEQLGGVEKMMQKIKNHFAGLMSEDTQRAILEELFVSAGGNKWKRKQYWGMRNLCLGEWEGVSIDEVGSVSEVGLDRNGLVGELPLGTIRLMQMGVDIRMSGNRDKVKNSKNDKNDNGEREGGGEVSQTWF